MVGSMPKLIHMPKHMCNSLDKFPKMISIPCLCSNVRLNVNTLIRRTISEITVKNGNIDVLLKILIISPWFSGIPLGLTGSR